MRAAPAKEHDRPQALREPPPIFFGLNVPGYGSFQWVRFLWWLPLLASLAGMAILRSIHPVWVYHSGVLLLLLNFVFLTVVSMMVALVAGRAFLSNGFPWLLLLGSGAVVWGSSAVLVASVVGGDANGRAIVFDVSVWLAAFCHLLGTLALMRRWRAVERPAQWLALCYTGGLLAAAGVARAASASLTLVLFAQGGGGAVGREILLPSSIAMFAGSALLLRRRNRGGTSAFLQWYWMAMLLVAAGLLGIFLQPQFDSALTWLARATLYAGGSYMLTAVVLSMRETGGLSLEAELLEARRQYEDLFALAADGIILHLAEEAGEAGRIVRANPAVCAMLGYEAAELAELRFMELVAPGEQEAAAAALAATEPGGTLWHERTLAAKDGRRIRAEINSRLFHYGRPMVLSTIRDITERTLLQEAMRQRAEEIQTVMDVAPVAIFVAQDPDCNVIVGNRAANQLYEAGAGENVSSNATEARRVFRGGRELSPAELPMQKAAATNSEIRGAELEILLPSGRRLTLIGSGMPLRDAGGGVRGCVGAFLDISDREHAARALRERERRLQLAVGGAKLGVFEWDLRTDTWVWENDLMYEIFGRTCAEGPLNKEGILQTIVGEDVPGFLRALKKVTSPDRKFHATCRIVRKNDRAVRWVEFLGDFEFAEQNTPIRLVGVVRDVTERRQAEEDVRKGREWLRVTLRSIGDGVIATDTDGKIVFLNPVAANLTGWSIEEALGHPVTDVFRVIGEGAGEPAEDVIGRVMRERGVVELSNHSALVTRDGSEIPIEDSAAPILERDGTIAGVVVVFHDVAEQRLAQRALKESEQRLRAVGDNLPEAAIYRYSHRPGRGRGAMEFISAGYERLTGVPIEEALRRPASFFELMPPEDARRLRDANTAAVVRLTPFETEVRLKHRLTGQTRWMMVRAVGSRREDGSSVLDGVMLDITERKQAEEQVRRSNAILDARNRMLRSAITCENEKDLGRACVALAEELTQSQYGLLAEIGADGAPTNLIVSDACRAAYEAAGIDEDSIPVRFNQASLCIAALHDGRTHFCNDPEAVREQILVPENHPKIESLMCVPLLHEGRAFGLLATANRRGGYSQHEQRALEDLALGFVTAVMRMRAEKAARAGEERLRDAQKMESIGLLAGGIAHDFNNLLVGIVGNASLAEDMLPYGSPASQALRRIVSAGEQAAHLTRQMLAYAGKGRFIIGAVDISKIVTDSNALIQSSISKKISMRVSLDPSAHPVESDPSQMQQVYMNLALNAAEAIGTEVGVITVSTRAELIGEAEIQRGLAQWPIEPGLFTCLEVCDTGCGMPQSTRARIFEPFFTTKFQGRGLGLAAVAGIVRAHKGAIQVISAPGEGSAFRVYLPAVNRPAEVLSSPGEAEEAERCGGEILVVDDEESVCELVTVALDRMGYHVYAARGGAEAIKIMAERGGEVDLILLDMSMPGMSGQETLDRLRAVRPDIRVVVSSGYSESETLRAFGGSRLSGFVQKPYTVHQLEEQIRAALSRPSSV